VIDPTTISSAHSTIIIPELLSLSKTIVEGGVKPRDMLLSSTSNGITSRSREILLYGV